jgi:hypothetical protein
MIRYGRGALAQMCQKKVPILVMKKILEMEMA